MPYIPSQIVDMDDVTPDTFTVSTPFVKMDHATGKFVGAAGVEGDKTYIHNQLSPSSVWTVTHNLGKRPSIHVEDSAGTEVIGDIHHIDVNTLTLTFGAPFGGVATCN